MLFIEYLLLGVAFGLFMEHFGKYLDIHFNMWERVAMWMLWPILAVVVLYHFFKEFFKRDQ